MIYISFLTWNKNNASCFDTERDWIRNPRAGIITLTRVVLCCLVLSWLKERIKKEWIDESKIHDKTMIKMMMMELLLQKKKKKKTKRN